MIYAAAGCLIMHIGIINVNVIAWANIKQTPKKYVRYENSCKLKKKADGVYLIFHN